jgi:hypothetical protein
MALLVVGLVGALSAALLVTSGVGPGTAEAKTAWATGTVVAWRWNGYGQTDTSRASPPSRGFPLSRE